MTRKDYVLIADAIAIALREIPSGAAGVKAAEKVVEHLEHALELDNPRFDVERFRKYILSKI